MTLGDQFKAVLPPASLRDVFREIQGQRTDQQFADHLGISYSHVYRIRVGERKVTGILIKKLFGRCPKWTDKLLAAIRSERI